MSRKKRQTVTLLVLCLVLIAAGVGYYALIRHQAAPVSYTHLTLPTIA